MSATASQFTYFHNAGFSQGNNGRSTWNNLDANLDPRLSKIWWKFIYKRLFYVPIPSITTAQALTASIVTSTATMVRSVGKLVTATIVTSLATIVRQIAKSITASAITSTATMIRSMSKTLITSVVTSLASAVENFIPAGAGGGMDEGMSTGIRIWL